MAGVIQRDSYVEVYFWLARNKDDIITTASEGARQSQDFPESPARCGHVSMGTFMSDRKIKHISFWPSADHIGAFVPTFEGDCALEGSLPDVIIRLHQLAVGQIHDTLARLETRVTRREIRWVLIASDTDDITNPATISASCATFVWSLLQAGNFGTHSYSPLKLRGPRDAAFYAATLCNAGDRWLGLFNGAYWTKAVFSPKALLLRVAGAAEELTEDRASTLEINNSPRVSQRARQSASSSAIAGGITAGLAALTAALVLIKRK